MFLYKGGCCEAAISDFPSSSRRLLRLASTVVQLGETIREVVLVTCDEGSADHGLRELFSQCGHNGFDIEQGKLRGHFRVFHGPEEASQYVYPGSRNYVFFRHPRRHLIVDILKVETACNPPNSVSIGHGYGRQEGAG